MSNREGILKNDLNDLNEREKERKRIEEGMKCTGRNWRTRVLRKRTIYGLWVMTCEKSEWSLKI